MMLMMIVKFYVVDIIKVNSQDMKSTLFSNDVLLVQRAFNHYKANDIVYLRYPARDSVKGKAYCFQRLVGLPGDTVLIADKKVYVNGKLLGDTSSVQYNYYLKAGENGIDSAAKELFHLTEGGKISGDEDYSFSLTNAEMNGLSYLDAVKKINVKCEQHGSFDQTVFPWSPRYRWNMDNFGELYIPKKNDTIHLDSLNIELYSTLIKTHEGNELELRNDSIFINEEAVKFYVVKKNYYFLMGDNRDNANDSRVYGFLPENYLRGKMIRLIKKNRD